MDYDDIETYIQSIEDTAADMRAALAEARNPEDEWERGFAHEELRDYASTVQGHALDIIEHIKQNQE